MQELTLLQSFNAMHIFLSQYLKKTDSDDIATLLTTLHLSKNRDDWQINPSTIDPTGWRDWIKSVNETLKKNNITQIPNNITYNTLLSFMCMKTYIEYFYFRFDAFKDIGRLIIILNNCSHMNSDQIWQQWLQAVDQAIYETYPLDTPLNQ